MRDYPGRWTSGGPGPGRPDNFLTCAGCGNPSPPHKIEFQIEMIRCIALDIDDTLIQTSRALAETKRKTVEYIRGIASLGFLEGGIFSALDAIISYFGTGTEQEFLHALCFEGGKRGKSLQRTAQAVNKYFRRQFLSCLEPFPRCEVLLKELTVQGMSLGIISNGQEEFQKTKLAFTGLVSYFPIPDRVLISSSFGPAAEKPSQIMYRRFIEKSGCLPQEILFVGDKLSDIVGANLADMVSVWVLQGKAEKYRSVEFKPRLRIEKADYVIQEIGELSSILAETDRRVHA